MKANTYDYVIVGAGSAGCVLANRLSADPAVRVLVLEAGGPDRRLAIRMPAAFATLFKSDVDWNYSTEPQPHMDGRSMYWPRGKVLGGSSSINAMMYVRGHARDYDAWRDAGNTGWGYDDVLPYFLRSEDQQRGASEFHATGGPLAVSDLRTVNPVSRAFVEAAVETGLERNRDFNGARQDGTGFYQVTQRNGRRHSAAAAFLLPVMRRPNLTVLTHAHATRITVERATATGVTYVRNGREVHARATREVVLAGGAVNSPQLLLLSGIGPADALRRHAIDVVADLPGVGENLQDHLLVINAYRCTEPVTLADAQSLANLARYAVLRSGPLTSNVAEAGAFITTTPEAPSPDVQLLFGPAFYLNHGFTKVDGHGFSIGPVLLRPRSRGRLWLRSADPHAAPAIDPGYLTDERDLDVLVEGLRRSRDIANAQALACYRGTEYAPNTDVVDNEGLRAFVRRSAETLYHPVGTCRMGAGAEAVVDPELRVRGIGALRVADASVMPDIVSGNTNAPTIMIGEKAAALLLGESHPGRG